MIKLFFDTSGTKLKSILLGLLLVLGAASFSFAAEEFSLGQKGQNPTRISAQKLVYNQASREVEFVGQVHVVRPDFELWCKKMSVFLADRRKEQSGQVTNPGIERIVARGEVRTETDGRKSWSDKAVYQTGSEVITLEGNVLLKEEMNEIKGSRVVLYLNENRAEIFSGEDGRVDAVFYPSKDQE